MFLLLADDHPLMRRGVIEVIQRAWPQARFAEASSAAEMFGLLRAECPDVLVLDLSLPDRDGLDCLVEVARRYPALPVLILSMHQEQVFALRALDQGAMGYLTKDRAATDVVGAIERLLAGRRYISPDLAEQLATRREAESAPHERLSAREFRVMRALAVGTSLTDIATQLSLSPKTVTTYRARVLTKLGIENNAELVRYCVAHKLID